MGLGRQVFSSACAVAVAYAPAAAGTDYDASLEVSAYADTDNVAVLTPALGASVADATRGLRANGSYVVDLVSGASVDIVSTASERWTEVRQAADLAVDVAPDELGVNLSGGVSREPDYLSWSLGAVVRVGLADRHVTPSLGYAYSSDTAGRKDTPFSVYALRARRHAAQLGVELVTSRSSRLTVLSELMLESGRQEKPYRFLPLFDQSVASGLSPGEAIERVNLVRLPGRVDERLPDSRRRHALTLDWARRGDAHTLRVNQRLYADDWGLLASTSDLSGLLELYPGLELWGHARLHVQSSVDFWRLGYVGEVADGRVSVPRYRSGDRELSGLFTAAFGVGADYRFGSRHAGWVLGGLVEASHTRFAEALFIRRRWSGLVGLELGRAF